ncbi:MAG: 2TM domain-containing protein [Ardenticatenaceae bacterium]|nr:2TM domain-containing protein [Ardenticatenaceae bacterium]
MNNQEAYQRAKKRVTAKVGFYRHLTIYIAVNILLIIINVSTSTEYLWFIWPLMGWGLAVVLHALRVFAFSGESGATERMIEKEMERGAAKQQ